MGGLLPWECPVGAVEQGPYEHYTGFPVQTTQVMAILVDDNYILALVSPEHNESSKCVFSTMFFNWKSESEVLIWI